MVRTFKNPQGGSLGGCFEPGGGTLGGTGANHNGTFHNGHHTGGEFDSSRRGHAIDYDDLLNQKRRAELQYRNGVDPFVNGPGQGGGMKGSSSETFLTRVAEPPPPVGAPPSQQPPLQEDFGLANGLNDLSNVLQRLQNHASDPDDSTKLTSISYPNSANNSQGPTYQNSGLSHGQNGLAPGPGPVPRQSWSAPQGGDPLGFKGPDSILPQNGPGEGPAYGRARMQAERNRIRQIAMNGSLSDPLESLKAAGQRQRNAAFNQPLTQNGNGNTNGHQQGGPTQQYNGQQGGPTQQQYNPSMYDQQSNKRGGEQQITETRDRRKRETQENQDWWEKRKEPQFTVTMPTKPHPSQTADQRPDPRLGQKSLQEELRVQMELKKQREADEKSREREEEAKLEKRIQEQQERMKKEFEEEQAKKKAKEQAKVKRQEDMARRQQEIQKEAENQRKEVAERKFQERKAARVRRQEEERDANGTNGGDSSRGSTPTPVPPGADRVTSPPIPAIRNSQGGGNSSNNSEFESGSMGLSSDDDQVQQQQTVNNRRQKLDF